MPQPITKPPTARMAAAQAGTESLGQSAWRGVPGATVVGTAVVETSEPLFIFVKMKGCSWRRYEGKSLFERPFYHIWLLFSSSFHWLFTHLCGTVDLTAVICEIIVVLFTPHRLQLKTTIQKCC